MAFNYHSFGAKSAEGFACPSCGHCGGQIAAFPTGVDLVQCLNCCAEMVHPIPTAEQLSEYYTTENYFSAQGKEIARAYELDPTTARNNAAVFAEQLANENGILRGARIVDIGCSYGTNLIEMARLGYDAWGIEPTPEAVEFIRKHGANAYAGFIEDPGCPVKWADVFFASHSLEHMRDPYSVIRRLFGMLRAGGVFALVVPNWGGIVARTKVFEWGWFGPPAHIHYFRKEPLVAMLRKTGFEVVSAVTSAFDEEVDEVAEACLSISTSTLDQQTRAAILKIMNLADLGQSLMIAARKPN